MTALDLGGARWRKSTRSSDVAVLDGARWRKSTRSTDNANCVEVAFAGPVVALRDSKNPAGSVLAIPPHAWTTFTTALRTDEFAC